MTMTEADLDELADRIVKMLTTTDFMKGWDLAYQR